MAEDTPPQARVYMRGGGAEMERKRRRMATHAAEGSLDALQSLHEAGAPWDERTCTEAAAHGHLDCLKYAHENGCPSKPA